MPELRELFDEGWSCPEFGDLAVDIAAAPSDRLLGLARQPFAALGIPAIFGGGDGTLLDVASAQRQVTHHQPDLGVGLTMHALSVGLVSRYWTSTRDHSWMLLQGLCETGGLIASAFAEPGGSANPLRARTVATPCKKGYFVTGTKSPCSLGSVARIYCVNAAVEGTTDTVVGLIPAGTEGVHIGEHVPMLGMTGSDNRTIKLNNAFLDERLIFHQADSSDVSDLVAAGVAWFAVLITATYIALLERLIEAAADATYSTDSCTPPQQRNIGMAVAHLGALSRHCQQVAHIIGSRQVAGAVDLAEGMALRRHLNSGRDAIVAALTPVLGSRVYRSDCHEAKLAIDLLAAHHHPPSHLVCEEVLGALALSRPVHLDLYG